jgi:hypothetical protein
MSAGMLAAFHREAQEIAVEDRAEEPEDVEVAGG